jgi:hypothetical protein
MDKPTFANVDKDAGWWLTRRELTPDINEVRTNIENDLDLGFEWFLMKEKLEQLYDVLERKDSALLRELDDVIEEADDTKRLAWITKAAAAVKNREEKHSAEPSEKQPAEAQAAEHEDSQPQQPVAERHQPAAAFAASQEPPPATWDAGWGMFLRYTDGKYLYSLGRVLADGPGTDTPAGEPDGTWYDTCDAATAARSQVAELRTTVSDFVNDDEDAISPEALDAALSTPGFKEMVDNADKELEAALAALDEG